MDKPIEEMTYVEFNSYCNDRACDGQWGIQDALACIGMMNEVEDSARGKFFKRKARESAWESLKAKYS
jgi:hypothetical protein